METNTSSNWIERYSICKGKKGEREEGEKRKRWKRDKREKIR